MNKMKVQVCHGKTCTEKFSEYINTRLENDKNKFELNNLKIEDSKCMGYCKKGPNIKVDGILYHYINPAKAAEIIQQKTKKKKNNFNNKKI